MAVRTRKTQCRPPYEAYARIMGVFAGGLAVAGACARLLDRDPRAPDLARSGDAFGGVVQGTRTIARDDVRASSRAFRRRRPTRARPGAPVQTGDMEQAIPASFRNLQSLHRHVEPPPGSQPRADPHAALRAHADLDARRRGRQRFPAGRVRRAHAQRQNDLERDYAQAWAAALAS